LQKSDIFVRVTARVGRDSVVLHSGLVRRGYTGFATHLCAPVAHFTVDLFCPPQWQSLAEKLKLSIELSKGFEYDSTSFPVEPKIHTLDWATGVYK
jgi:hypothetical protein